MKHCLCALLSLVALPAVVHAQASVPAPPPPAPAQKIAAAVLALPQEYQADARVLGYAPGRRELSVLRLVSTGSQCHDMAKALGLGEETIRSHLKKAQAKLGVRNRAHAVAEALRQNLIP